jgi:hypothetical protein
MNLIKEDIKYNNTTIQHKMRWMIISSGIMGMMMMAWSFHIPFDPMSPRELHPSVLPLCANCNEAIHNNKHSLCCRLFGKTDPVWGVVHYQSCTVARNNTHHCGPSARYYIRSFEN